MEFSNFFFCLFVLLDPQINYLVLFFNSDDSNLTLKLMLHHDELKNVNHVVLRGALVEVSGIQILFHWIGLKSWSRNMCNTTLYPPLPLPTQPTYIRHKKANQDRVKWHRVSKKREPSNLKQLAQRDVFFILI